MAIVVRYGKPDLFVTMTCNPKWREVEENLPGQTATDRPDLIARVFHLKVKELFEDLLHRHVLGEVVAYVSVYEWQKRGLPHLHLLLILNSSSKLRTADDVDRLIRAELPDMETERELFEIISSTMIHRPCGTDNPNSPCMYEGACSKHFPKSFRLFTEMIGLGYPEYRRRDDGRSVQCQGKTMDNRHVVPYNEYLSLRYQCHINVEVCALIQVVKYLFKYVYKGADRAELRLSRMSTGTPDQPVDEIKQHLDARYICAPEAMHRILSFELEKKSHAIYKLAVHLPEEQSVVFHGNAVEEAVQNAAMRESTLMAWFTINAASKAKAESGQSNFVDSRQYHYLEMPTHFTFSKNNYKWAPRIRGTKTIGRMYTVSPTEVRSQPIHNLCRERFALRLLLLQVTGAISFEDLKTVTDEDGNVVVHDTFVNAAKARGILKDDSHYLDALKEAAQFQMPLQLRETFVGMMGFCEVYDRLALWNEVKKDLAEDFVHSGMSAENAEAMAYYDISDRLERMGKQLSEWITPPRARPFMPAASFDPQECEAKGEALYETLNERQKAACDAILSVVNDNSNTEKRLFFIDGPGGSGKTYLYQTLFNILIGQGKKVACTAWAGIAATLLPGGRTTASLFKLDIDNQCKTSKLIRQEKAAREPSMSSYGMKHQ